MRNTASNELDLAGLRPKAHLERRLMFDGFSKWLTWPAIICLLVAVGTALLSAHLIMEEEQRFKQEGKFVWLFLLMPVGFLFGAVLCRATARLFASSKARLLSQGTLTTGVVESKSELPGISKMIGWPPPTIRFRFQLPGGESRTGENTVIGRKFAAKLDPGKRVGVVYLPDDPARCRIFRDKWAKHFERGIEVERWSYSL